jgi:hypothetical protein
VSTLCCGQGWKKLQELDSGASHVRIGKKMNKNEKQRKVEAEGEKGVSSAEKREEERTVSHSCENLQLYQIRTPK